MKLPKIMRSPYTSLVTNFTYALGNGIIGFHTHSWWFITIGAYHAILAMIRSSVLRVGRKPNGDHARLLTGIMLVVLSFCVIGINVLSVVENRGTDFHEIIMITIATFVFAKISLAIIGMVKADRTASPVMKTLRNLSLADACVSIYTMQRSMLVSFPGMEPTEIQLFNILTGTAVWITVLLLGIDLIGGKNRNDKNKDR